MKTRLTRVLLLTVLCGCASPDGVHDREGRIKPGDPSRIALGMTKLEVMRALGRPETISAEGNSETLYYRLERPWWQDKPFKVRLTDGKAVSFGVVESDR
jgi:outer membrane protein assembly factor BamE (lipoprotein component of BamABCDE complex)